MTDQTPSEPIHPLAAMGIQLDTEQRNEAVSSSFAGLMRDMEAASHIADGIAREARAFADATPLLPEGGEQ